MVDGKYKEVLRTRFKEVFPDKDPITKAGNLSKDYEGFLVEECKPHWASVMSKFGKLVDKIDAKEITAVDALKSAREETIKEEKCSIGIGGILAKRKKLYEEKYGIEF